MTSNSTTNTEAELRQRLRELPRTDKFDFRYPIDAYEDDLVSLIQEETRKARLEDWKKACQDNWQCPIPEQYALDRIKELESDKEVKR